MPLTCRGGAGTAIHRAGGVDLIAAVRSLRALWHTFRQAGRRRWNIPHYPMRLIVGRLVADDFHVVHVEDEGLRPCWHVGPGDRG